MDEQVTVALLSGGFALAGALGGVLITQRRADSREAAAWERQVERERETWAREDAARTFDHRRQAYSDFYESLKAMALRAYNHGLGFEEATEDGELPEGWHTETFQRLQHLEVYATPNVARLAFAAYSATWQWGDVTKHGRDDDAFYDRQGDSHDAEWALLNAIRADLAIPER